MNQHPDARIWWRISLLAALLLAANALAVPANPSGDAAQDAMDAYHHAKPITGWEAKKLKKAIPELKQLQPDDDQSRLPALLSGVSGALAAFWKDFPSISATELITEDRRPIANYGQNPMTVTGGGITASGAGSADQGGRAEEQFRYTISLDPTANGKVAEARVDAQGRDAAAGGNFGYLRTSGFASQPLFFNAANQKLSDFRYLGTQQIDGRPTDVVAFAEHADPAAVLSSWTLGGEAVPILLQGIAWVDPSDFHIAQIRTELLARQPKFHLEKMTTIVQFKRQEVAGYTSALWLPVSAEVEADLGDKEFLNKHRFSDFKLSPATP